MLREKYVSYYITNIFLDGFIAFVSLILAFWLRSLLYYAYLNFDFPFHIPELGSFNQLSWLFFVMIPLWPILMDMNGAYSSMKFSSIHRTCWIILKSVIQATAILIFIMYVFKIEGVSRIFVFITSGISIVLLVTKEFMARIFLFSFKRSEIAFRNIIIIGKGTQCEQLIKTFSLYSFWGLRITGIVSTSSTDTVGNEIRGVKIIGLLPDLSELMIKYPTDEIIFSAPLSIEKMQSIIQECEELGIKVRIPLNYFDTKIARASLESFHEIPLLTFTTTSTKVLDLFFKYYIFDKILGLILLLFASPLMLCIAIGIKISSKGPVLFKQTRSGLYGRPFMFYKFRSMHVGAEQQLEQLRKQNEMDGPVFKMKDDPRVTPLGKFLRYTSLDELPQLFNVLKGEMSIVGPRPPLPKEVTQYERWQRRKLSMKPGLTCIWQISGRNEITDFNQWMKLDLEYIDNWSLWLDFKIFFQTIYVVLTMHGAR